MHTRKCITRTHTKPNSKCTAVYAIIRAQMKTRTHTSSYRRSPLESMNQAPASK